MKSKFLFSLLAGSLFFQNLIAQNAVPQGFSYQAIVRDTNGALLANKAVVFYFDVREGTPQGNAAYSENTGSHYQRIRFDQSLHGPG